MCILMSSADSKTVPVAALTRSFLVHIAGVVTESVSLSMFISHRFKRTVFHFSNKTMKRKLFKLDLPCEADGFTQSGLANPLCHSTVMQEMRLLV